MSESSPSLAHLRADLHRAAEIADVGQRTLEVVAVIEEAATPLGIRPTIVGGMAVYFWTEGDAFATYDIDVVMAVPEKLAEILAQLGFVRSKDGRHWELPDTEVLLEAPSADLDAGVQVAVVRLPSGRTARVLSRVDILLDRLDEFQTTGHRLVAQQALVLLTELTAAEQADLDARAPARRLTVIVDSMRRLARELPSRSEPPAVDELHEIARAALRAEYSPRQS
ncbi:MAG TPA: hypothetical protein VK506_13220 [Conexibacter sp.]|nr:hypothetical protein [Conexibacter sp.]